jgi:molecular chaperone GrpE
MTRSPRELATQKIQLRKQQEALLRDLLTVVDALDRASAHWQQAEAQHRLEPPRKTSRRWWQRLLKRLGLGRRFTSQKAATSAATLEEVVGSAGEGIDMIRQSLLTVLEQHQVVPIEALGRPFDPSQMHALAQQPDASVPPQTVVQEVVRGYRWQDRMLREAQVIVAATPTTDPTADTDG